MSKSKLILSLIPHSSFLISNSNILEGDLYANYKETVGR